jgi:hypothetical protein
VKIICSSSGGAQEKRKDRMKLSLSPEWVEKLVSVPVIFVLVEFSFPVTCLMPYYAQNWPFSSPNHVTLRITLMHCVHW